MDCSGITYHTGYWSRGETIRRRVVPTRCAARCPDHLMRAVRRPGSAFEPNGAEELVDTLSAQTQEGRIKYLRSYTDGLRWAVPLPDLEEAQ